MAEVYFFGCWGQSGHYLHDRTRHNIHHHEADKLRIPSDHNLDGRPTFLPPEKVGDGAVTYLPACDLTVLAWWGSPWDKRGAVNNAVLVRGKHDADSAWAAFEQAYPSLVPHLTKPTIVAADRGDSHG